jgi:hypothetical protein
VHIHDRSEPFKHYEPTLWEPPGERFSDGNVYSVLREHGVKGSLHPHNLNDSINSDRGFLDKILLEYRIDKQSYPLFTVKDLFVADYGFTEESRGNIMGDIAERIARRVTKFFLKHHSPEGYTGGIFDKRFNPQKKNGYIITHNGRYLLKVQKYPNLIILKSTPEGEWSYDNIKELDGFFDYRFHGDRHIIVLESKLERLHINSDKLISNLFNPLKELFPESKLHYLLFSNRSSIFHDDNPYRILRSRPFEIYDLLKQHGVGTLFFSFNEKYREFERATTHLITQYRLISFQTVDINGRITIAKNRIDLYDSGERPFLSLRRERESGLWSDTPTS